MEEDLYREEILDHYYSSPHRGHIEAPDLTGAGDNPLCGDRICLDVKLDSEGRINEVRFDGEGCAISQAGASMLAEELEGLSLEEARRFEATDIIKRLGISPTSIRVKCGLLGWKVFHRALAEQNAEREQPGDGRNA